MPTVSDIELASKLDTLPDEEIDRLYNLYIPTKRIDYTPKHWREWLPQYFPHVCTSPLAPRHEKSWEWFDNLTPDVRPRPRIEVWPRGGAKSSVGELGCTYVGCKGTRKFVLYVCATQDQADKHVVSIAAHLERLRVDRLLNKYGSSRGWRRQELRAANGFNVSGIGLDVSTRGVKIDEYRPDLMIFDDVDDRHDTARTVEKKIATITTSILPAGSSNFAVLFLQNKVHIDGIVTQLCDGRADFLHDRETPIVEPAILNLKTESYSDEEGRVLYRITEGVPTWEGQGLEVCTNQMNTFGLTGFLREAQHEVETGEGYVFNVDMLNYCDESELPIFLRECRAWDLAATEGAGDWTVGSRIGIDPSNGRVYVRHIERGQWDSFKVEQRIEDTAIRDQSPKVKLRLPQDPAQAGKYQANQLESKLARFKPIIKTVSGDKITRAFGFSQEVNKGNVWFVNGPWNYAAKEELRRIRENVTEQVDDIMDAFSDAYNEIKDTLPPSRGWIG